MKKLAFACALLPGFSSYVNIDWSKKRVSGVFYTCNGDFVNLNKLTDSHFMQFAMYPFNPVWAKAKLNLSSDNGRWIVVQPPIAPLLMESTFS